MSYDVTSLFTNVPLEETIQILAEKAFAQDWFNETHSLNLSKTDLIDLLRAATKNQLFQFDGALYEQTDGVAMGHPLDRCWLTSSCAGLRKTSNNTVNFRGITGGTSMTP